VSLPDFWEHFSRMQELMCHSCASRNPGCFVPATVFLLGKRELWDTFWIPAFAEMTIQGPLVCHSRESGRPVVSFLDSCLRRNDTSPLHPASLRRPLDSQGRGGLLHSAKVLYISMSMEMFLKKLAPSEGE
jgi:hypothetical protein